MSWASGIFLIVVVALVQTKPQYEVQVQSPVSFSYTSGNQNQLFDGTCCSPNETNSCLSAEINCCFTACNETQITLCFREAQHSTNDSDSTNCPLGMATVLSDTVANITNNSTANLTTTTTYTGSFQLFYKVVALQPVREIDHGVSTLNYTIQDTFIRPKVNSGERAFLLIRGIRVVCREGYFGPDCGCTRNDSTGHCTYDTNGSTEAPISIPEIPSSTTHPTSLSILPIAVGGAVGGLVLTALVLVFVIVVVCVCKCKSKKNQPATRGVVTIAFTSEENPSNTEDDALSLYTQVNKENNTQQEEAPPINPYKEPHYSTPSNASTPQYSVPSTVPMDTSQYSTPLSKDASDNLKEPQYSTPISRGATLTRKPQYSTPVSTLPRDYPKETQYSTPVSKETTPPSTKKPQVVYADIKVSTLSRTTGDESTKSNKNDKIEVQYSEIQA